MKTFIFGFIFAFIFIALSIVVFYLFDRDIWYPYYEKFFIEQDVAPLECPKCPEPQTKIIERNITIVKKIEENLTSTQRLKRYLADSDFIIYPDKLTLIAIKHEKKLEVWGELNNQWRHIHNYNFTAFSGKLGPKLKEGDRQIPEGIYGISYLNPNSKFHLSMKIDYPNSFDKKMAKIDKRVNLGGDIMIHGSDKTIGCIPIGDESIEELYFLAQKVGIKNIKVILSPVDFRYMSVNIKNDRYPWLKKLYANIKKEMQPFISK